MKLKYLILFVIYYGVSGCQSKVEDKLISKINHDCGDQIGSKCIISFNDITFFKWDKLYFFRSWTTSSSIKDIIGFDYKGKDVQDDYIRMLFTKSNKVIYEEDFKSFDNSKSTMIFPQLIDSLVQTNPLIFIPANARFVADKSKKDDGCKTCFYYSMYTIK